MIVNTTNERWEIISQYAHGLLAGRIAEQIQKKYRPKQWVETMTAVIEHDDHQIDLKFQKCLCKNGSPMDFTLSEPDSEKMLVDRITALMEVSRYKSRWIALLISSHLEFLNNTGEVGSKMKRFLASEKEYRKKTVGNYGISEKQLEEHYQLLRFCDRLSLILCKNQVPALERELEINTSIANKTYKIRGSNSSKFVIQPWCFEDKSFTLSVETRQLPQPTFSSSSALKKALNNVEVTSKEFIISSKD